MANRKARAKVASETLTLLEQEGYPAGNQYVSLAAPLADMRAGTTLYDPDELDALVSRLDAPPQQATQIVVTNQTTFGAAADLTTQGYRNPLCLNFASAMNPGGGFLSGAQAQEECLARASGLHASLELAPRYYEANRSHQSSLYTNHLIYSPSVPVFRDDNDVLISPPYLVSIVTSPAVNAGAVRKNQPSEVAQIGPTMQTRIRSVLGVARQHAHDTLVLGAWGCGVFGNDPAQVAGWFHDALHEDARFSGAFKRVTFAVLDHAHDTPTFNAFAEVFGR